MKGTLARDGFWDWLGVLLGVAALGYAVAIRSALLCRAMRSS